MDYHIRAELLTKTYPSEKRNAPDYTVFEDLCMGLKKREFVTCIGHSGCGKSTILKILAGLDAPTRGEAFLGTKLISGPGLDRAVVFQNHGLLPWLSTLKNVMFAVKSKWPDWSRDQVESHSREFLELVGLQDYLHRRPCQLSGGMRQRVGIARAFAIKAELLLMDEPFGALDALTRGVIQDELIKIWNHMDQTVFMITHDVDEAILLSDRILLMTNGPHATIAESVVINLPRPRNRGAIIHEPGYYKIRNYLVDFLINRSSEKTPADSPEQVVSGTLRFPAEIDPLLHEMREPQPQTVS